jgi:hypothetical protein
MPITFVHLPFVGLLFLMVAAPSAFSYVLLMFPQSRPSGKKLWWGSFAAGLGIIAYQLVYIPIMLAGGLLSWAIWLSAAMVGSQITGDSTTFERGGVLILLLFFYVFWFLFLLLGYVIGFKAGLKFAVDKNWKSCVQADPLYRLGLWCFQWLTTYKRR